MSPAGHSSNNTARRVDFASTVLETIDSDAPAESSGSLEGLLTNVGLWDTETGVHVVCV
jgi:hypothetical protein